MKKLMALLGLVVMVGVLVACADDTGNGSADGNGNGNGETDDVLVMGTSADYPPFQFIDVETDDFAGFDIDLARLIAEELGYELEIVDMEFAGLITALRNNRVDMVLAGMSITEERLEVVDFSNVYYQANNGTILTLSGTITSMDDLDGLTLGVQTGTVQAEIGQSLVDEGVNVELHTMDRIPELVQELITGRVDGVILNVLVADGYAADNADFEVVVDVLTCHESATAIAFPQGSDLTERVNAILAQFEADGTMENLIQQWMIDDE